MKKRSKVELYEQIRKSHEHDELSIRALSERFGMHRRTVREALASPVPPQRKQGERPAPVLGPWKPTIDKWLADDQVAPRNSVTPPVVSGSASSTSMMHRSPSPRCATMWPSPREGGPSPPK